MVQAQAVVEELKREVDADPGASNRRIRAAKERGARTQRAGASCANGAGRDQAQAKATDRNGGNGKKPKDPRASTTDPQARVMKMADAGFRPAYNVQVASAAGELIVVTVDIDNNGSDRGLMRPMLERTHTLLKRFPRRHLVDGGPAVARISNGRMAKASRFTVLRPNPGAVSILFYPAAATAPVYWPGAPAWPAKPARHSTKPARSANASMPAGATGTQAIDRAWHRKGPRRRTLVRAHQQHPAGTPPRQGIAPPNYSGGTANPASATVEDSSISFGGNHYTKNPNGSQALRSHLSRTSFTGPILPTRCG